MKTPTFLTPVALFAASTLLAPSALQATPPTHRTFVVYANAVTYTSYYQGYADIDMPQADDTGRKASKMTFRQYEIVDLGTQVDDGIDLTYPRDVDDNTTFALYYDPRSKSYFDWDYEYSWTERQNQEWLFYSPGETIQTRSRIGKRYELRHYRDEAGFVADYYDEETEEHLPTLDQQGWSLHSEGAVTPVMLPATPLLPRGLQPTVWIPRKLSIVSTYFSRNPYGFYYYNDDTNEEEFYLGKTYQTETGRGTATYNATVTAWVNGLKGPLVDPVSNETIQPGSQAYAGLALVAYLKSLRYTNASEYDSGE